MDKKDKKILTELIVNSRIPINQLAKQVGISREVASYRLNNLIKKKVILGFYAVIDTEKLGFSRFTCFFQLKGITHEKEKEIIKSLSQNDFITYLSSVIGKWNIVFDLLAKDRNHLERIIKEITEKILTNLESYIIISAGAEQEMFPTKLLGIKKEIHYKKSDKKIKLDKIDLQILKLISTNSRIEYKELAEKIKLTANAIKYRIKNLEVVGIIKGYTASIDMRKLGYEWYNLQLKLTSNKKESELKRFLRQNLNVIYFYKYLGHENWDLDIGVIVKNSLELRDFILELREKFGDILKIYDIYIIVEESKPNQAPEGIFKT
jgi:Lrp/AsnC family leucine-responsive transcriptional regulator